MKSRFWQQSHRADPRALPLADRHYNRQKPGTPQFVPPGRCIVLLTPQADALWVSSWPLEQYVKHAWAGAWVCSCFRNESSHLSSALIADAVAVTRWFWRSIPALGMVTFVDPEKVEPKPEFGQCYRAAGWERIGETKGGLVTLQLPRGRVPRPRKPQDAQGVLF